MTALYPVQDVFTRGEISPRLHSRASLDLYRAALAKCENFVTLPHGGIRARGGTYFVNEVKNSAKKARGIPFIFSVDQAYCLEFGDLYIRVYAYGARVGTLEVASPWAESDLGDLSFYQSADVMWITHPNYQTRKLTREAHTTWTLALLDVDDGPYLDINRTDTTLTPAATANLSLLYAGSAAASHAPQFGTSASNIWDGSSGNIISLETLAGWVSYTFSSGTHICDAYSVTVSSKPLLAPTSWTFQGYNGSTWVDLDTQIGIVWFGGETKFFSMINTTAYSAYRLSWSATGDANGQYSEFCEVTLHQAVSEQTPFNLTASSTTGINGNTGFQNNDVGRAIRLRARDGFWRWAKIIARTSPTVVTVKMQDQALPGTSAIVYWRLGAWSTSEGWPDSVTVFEERLSFGKKYRINTSKTGDFDDFALGEKDDDAMEFLQAGGGQANDIVWIADSDGAMIIATAGGIRALSGSGIDEALTPSSFKNRRSRTFGCARIRPVDAGQSFLYVTRSRRAIAELTQVQTSRYQSDDIGQISEHIPKRGVVELAYQTDPDPILWFPLDNGELGGYTHQPSQEVRGLHRHRIGGTFAGSDWGMVEAQW
ncbi:MAG: hypothetical protein E5V74_10095 [Mesorhizobium sp.]|nr:MAG: hypothetical protein E5V74_10095 [Mesorhizobium sp.]